MRLPSKGIASGFIIFGESRVLHHFRVDAIAMRSRLICDPGEDHGLTGLELDAARERRPLSNLDVFRDVFPELEGAVIAPNLACLPRHAAIGLQIFLRNGHDESIHVLHVNAPLRFFEWRMFLSVNRFPLRRTRPPLRQMLGIGPCREHAATRRGDDAGDDKLASDRLRDGAVFRSRLLSLACGCVHHRRWHPEPGFDAGACAAQFSVMVFRLARPASKSLPTMPSMSNNTCMTFAM